MPRACGGSPSTFGPRNEKPQAREEAARRFHDLSRRGWRNTSKHGDKWIGSLERYAFPTIGDRPVALIQSADVLKVLSPIWFEVPETARRVRQRIRQVMQWAKGANLYEGENPVDSAAGSLPRQNAQAQHFPAMPYEELPSFMADFRA